MLTDDKILDDPRRALQLGLGIYSPLWPTFIAAAGVGVAFWTWAQWARGKAQNEFVGAAGLGVAPATVSTFPPLLEPEPVAEAAAIASDLAVIEEPVAPAVEAVSEALYEAPTVEAAPEPEPAPVEVAAPEPEPAPAPVEIVPEPIEAAAPEPVAAAPIKPARVKKPAPAKKASPVVEAAAPAPEPAAPETKPEPPAPAPPARKPRALSATASLSPRKARAAKAAGVSVTTGAKRRGSPRRKG